MILKIFDSCKEIVFGMFLEVTGGSGMVNRQLFWFLIDFVFFVFLGFFGRSENFGGRLRRCACGCQYDVRIPQDSLDLIMMAYIFSPPLAPLGNVVKSQGKVMKSR